MIVQTPYLQPLPALFRAESIGDLLSVAIHENFYFKSDKNVSLACAIGCHRLLEHCALVMGDDDSTHGNQVDLWSIAHKADWLPWVKLVAEKLKSERR